jgi:hypothetical protein
MTSLCDFFGNKSSSGNAVYPYSWRFFFNDILLNNVNYDDIFFVTDVFYTFSSGNDVNFNYLVSFGNNNTFVNDIFSNYFTTMTSLLFSDVRRKIRTLFFLGDKKINKPMALTILERGLPICGLRPYQ